MSSIPPRKLIPYDVKEGEHFVGTVILGKQTARTLPYDVIKHTELTFVPDDGRTPKYYMSIEQHIWFRNQWRNRAAGAETLRGQLAEKQLHWEESLKEIERLTNALGQAQALLQSTQEELRIAKQKKPYTKARCGFVYVIKQANGTHYKIGRTSDPDNRLRTFNVKLPFPVEFEQLIKCDDMYALETELHNRFALKRAEGEWFALDADDLSYIRSIESVT